MSSRKFIERGKNFKGGVVGVMSGVIVCFEPHDPHPHLEGPVRGEFYEPVVAGISSSISTYFGTGITTFGR